MGPETLQISQLRLEGYKQALRTNNIPFDPQLVKVVDFTKQETERAMHALMEMPCPPTAVFAFKNYITLDAIGFLKKNYPDRLGITNFTDFGNLSLFDYIDQKPVASIQENFFEVGKQAALLLFEMIDSESGDHKIKNIEIPCELIVHS